MSTARYTAFLLLAAPLITTGQQLSCQEVLTDAKVDYAANRPEDCLAKLRSDCSGEKRGDVLLFKAMVELQGNADDSLRSTLEQWLRHEKGRKLDLTNALVVQNPGLATELKTVRAAFRKDQGLMRAGLFASGVVSLPRPEEMIPVFSEDEPLVFEGGTTFSGGALAEIEVIPNLSLRLSAAYLHLYYKAKSTTQYYEENINMGELSLGVKKAFWFNGAGTVPYGLVRGSYALMTSAEAKIDRTGDDLRHLPEKQGLDRLPERQKHQFWLGVGAGVGRKVGSRMVVYVEGYYDLALTDITRKEAPYTESELLTNYYYADTPLRIDKLGIVFGAQYVFRYHQHNRIY